VERLLLLDATGRLAGALAGIHGASEAVIDVRGLASGLYTVVAEDAAGRAAARVAIQR